MGIGFNTGLRISDIRRLKWKDLMGRNLTIVEKKTENTKRIRAHRVIKINDRLRAIINLAKDNLGIQNLNEYIIVNRYGDGAVSVSFINRKIKEVVIGHGMHPADDSGNICTHIMRKTFGRRVWEKGERKAEALILLSKVFNHSSVGQTITYLGITQNEIEGIYENLN